MRSFPFVSNGAESVYGVKPEDIMNDAEMTVFRTPIVRAYRKPFEDSVRKSYKTMPVIARVCVIPQSYLMLTLSSENGRHVNTAQPYNH